MNANTTNLWFGRHPPTPEQMQQIEKEGGIGCISPDRLYAGLMLGSVRLNSEDDLTNLVREFKTLIKNSVSETTLKITIYGAIPNPVRSKLPVIADFIGLDRLANEFEVRESWIGHRTEPGCISICEHLMFVTTHHFHIHTKSTNP